MSDICPECGQQSGTILPGAALQPVLDQLAYSNPETLRTELRSGEIVLVQCRANVGGLVGTDQRVLVVKNGQAHEFSYMDIEDIFIEKVGWFLDAVCQLVTAPTPYQAIKSKAADAAPNAVSLIRPWLALYESAKVRILEIRDSRKCRNCGAFVPIDAADWAGIEQPQLIEPIPSSGAVALAPNLLPGERILCQAHGAAYYKTMIVTDQRVLTVLGRGEKSFHALSIASLDGVETDADGLYLHVKGKHFQKMQGMALVNSESGIPANEDDLPKLQVLAGVIEELIQRKAT